MNASRATVLVCVCFLVACNESTSTKRIDAAVEGEDAAVKLDRPVDRGDVAQADLADDRAPDLGPDRTASDSGPVSDGGPTSDGGPAGSDSKLVSDAFFGAPRCPNDALFCESFESSTLDPAKWSIGAALRTEPTKYTKVTVDSTRAARGLQSLHVQLISAEIGGLGFANTVKTFPVAGKQTFIRAFVWIDKLMPNRHFGSIQLTDTASTSTIRMHVLPTSESLPNVPASWYWRFLGSTSTNKASTERMPLGEWACWEMEYDYRTAAGEWHFYLNDVKVPSLDWLSRPSLTAATLSFGVNNGHVDIHPKPDGFNIWYDEIMVSDKRIGCVL
jgi:hypothetical protein